MEILNIENLSFKYPSASKKAIENINLSISSGDFTVICGQSGCGKTTLLKLLKKELAPVGEKSGSIVYKGIPQEELPPRLSSAEIGFVMQNPDNQIVTDKVWHELAFGLENLGLDKNVIRRQVGEIASFFGIQDWFRMDTDCLSGGQKQLLNLASVMVMQPEILILDEPTAQLDPITAADFIATLQKLNRELGITVILAEHRLEEVFPIADKVIIMDKGGVLLCESPKNIGKNLNTLYPDHSMLKALPSALKIFNALNLSGKCPLTVKEGRNFLEKNFTPNNSPVEIPEYIHKNSIAVELNNVWFRYQKNSADILRNTSLKVYIGEFYCILGGNGAGKTTMLNIISGLNKAYQGKVCINGKSIKAYRDNSLYRNMLALLPQNPQTVFVKDSVREDFEDFLVAIGAPIKEIPNIIENVSEKLGITHLLNSHPYDLSGGEQQKCAFAKILLSKPQIVLLDEPTKGLDAHSKQGLKDILHTLKAEGITIIAVTHDIEFAAEAADRCALLFDGEIISEDIPTKFFADNSYYTTAANRMARGLWRYAVTNEQVVEYCLKSVGNNL